MFRQRLRTLNYEFLYILCNYIICNIPCWVIRRALYRILGMKIGEKTRILLKTKVLAPSRITIGDRTTINENCFLDGRGTLTIGNDVSISFNTKILTASHNIKSAKFEYESTPVNIGDRVFIGIDSIILKGCILEDNVVIAAGSVAKKGVYQYNKIYSGVPAALVKSRELESPYKLGYWTPWFI